MIVARVSRGFSAGFRGRTTRQARAVPDSLAAAAINQLMNKGLAYPCICSRSEINQAASAPHPEDSSSVYPGTCRALMPAERDARTLARELGAIVS